MDNTQVVSVESPKEETVIREYTLAEAERTFTLSEETIAILMETTSEADGRGLNSSMQFWAERFIKQHAKVQANLWKVADDKSIFANAQRGSQSAKLAVLASLGIKGDAATQLLKGIK